MKFVIIIFFILISTIIARCEDKYLKLNDTVLIASEKEFNINIFAYNSSIDKIQKLLDRFIENNSNIDFSISLYIQDKFTTSKNSLHDNINIIEDYVGAYREICKIKTIPYVLIANNQGLVKNLFVLDSLEFIKLHNETKIENYAGENEFQISRLRYINKIILKDSLGLIKENLIPFTGYKSENYFCFSSIINNRVSIYDSLGTQTNNINLDSLHIKYHSLILGDIRNRDFEIYIFNPYIAKYIIASIDLSNNKLKKVFQCKNNDTLNYSPFFNCAKINDTLYLINQMVYDFKVLKDEPSLVLYNTNTGEEKHLSHYENIYKKYKLSNYFTSGFCCDDSLIYEIQNLSDTIRVYKKNGILIKSLFCNFDSTKYRTDWKNIFTNIDYSTPLEIIKSLSYQVTTLVDNNSLLIDKVNKDLYVCYKHNILSKQGINYNQKYLHKQGNKTNEDIILPLDSQILSVNNGIIYIYLFKNNTNYILKYEFSE